MAKIVVAEDETDIREMIGFMLRFAGHEVFDTDNGQSACELCRSEKPDLLLLDVRMPVMTGYEACRIIKNDPELSYIPVVFVSAKGLENEIAMGFAAGADEYIVKPFTMEQLLNSVKKIIEKKAE